MPPPFIAPVFGVQFRRLLEQTSDNQRFAVTVGHLHANVRLYQGRSFDSLVREQTTRQVDSKSAMWIQKIHPPWNVVINAR